MVEQASWDVWPIISIASSAVIGLSIAAYMWRLQKNRDCDFDKKTWRVINEKCSGVRDLYFRISEMSESADVNESKALHDIDQFLSDRHASLESDRDHIIGYRNTLRYMNDEQQENVDEVVACIEWLAREYFRPNDIPDSRLPRFLRQDQLLREHRGRIHALQQKIETYGAR